MHDRTLGPNEPNVYDDSQSPQSAWTNSYIHAEPCIFSPGKIICAGIKQSLLTNLIESIITQSPVFWFAIFYFYQAQQYLNIGAADVFSDIKFSHQANWLRTKLCPGQCTNWTTFCSEKSGFPTLCIKYPVYCTRLDVVNTRMLQ